MRFDLSLDCRFVSGRIGRHVQRRFLMLFGFPSLREVIPQPSEDRLSSDQMPIGFALAPPRSSGKARGGR